MGSFANTVFRIMLSWLQGAVSAVWSAFTSEKGGSFLEWIGNNWIPIALVLCLIGLVADLGIYIVRWKPFRVWKSFFTRRKQRNDIQMEESLPVQKENDIPQSAEEVSVPAVNVWKHTQVVDAMSPDLSRWEDKSEEQPEEQRTEILPQPTVTGAGYVVPADSPYRRPKEVPVFANVQETASEPEEGMQPEEYYAPATMRSRKRRRLNVSDLFSNPEEEMYDFEAPQQLIDSRKAYHEPVYPRGWKKSEDRSQ